MPTPTKKPTAKPAPKKPEPVVRDKARMMTGAPHGQKPAQRPAPLSLRAMPRESMFTPAQQREIAELVKRELAQLVAGLDTHAVLSLFHRNLQAVEAWYRTQTVRHEADVYTVVGISIVGVSYCLELAMAGKEWTPALDAAAQKKAGGK
jgi:hypothetical protein